MSFHCLITESPSVSLSDKGLIVSLASPAGVQISYLILILHLCVRESGRSREVHSTRANNFSFFSSLDLDVTCSSSLTQLAMALAATKVSRFKKPAGQN